MLIRVGTQDEPMRVLLQANYIYMHLHMYVNETRQREFAWVALLVAAFAPLTGIPLFQHADWHIILISLVCLSIEHAAPGPGHGVFDIGLRTWLWQLSLYWSNLLVLHTPFSGCCEIGE